MLKALREAGGFRQQRMAVIMGMSVGGYQGLEGGRVQVRRRHIYLACMALAVELSKELPSDE